VLWLRSIFIISFLSLSSSLKAEIKPYIHSEKIDIKKVFFSNYKSIDKLHIYLDADRSNHFASAHSIELGMHLALSEIGFKLWDKEVELFLLDHHGNTSRVKRHLKLFINDDNAIAYFSGIHSPPLIKLREYINQNKILTLVPWAAAGPVTRYPSKENYVFRLSIDDTKAGNFISNYAVTKHNCKQPHLLLEDTAWGDSSLKSMSQAFFAKGINPAVTRFSLNLEAVSAQKIIRDIVNSNADCIQLVANSIEGAKFTSALAKLPEEQRIPIISHGGIVGGDFHRKIDSNTRSNLNLSFIQTSFSFLQNYLNDFQKDVLSRVIEKYPCVESAKALKAPNGFIHSYDLMRIFIQATRQVNYQADAVWLRQDLKTAMENLDSPVQGLIKNYQKPFREFSNSDPDAHEALSIEDFAMARYGAEDEVILIR
jgi:branched-chain amino acid transport system substrate-binding protein